MCRGANVYALEAAGTCKPNSSHSFLAATNPCFPSTQSSHFAHYSTIPKCPVSLFSCSLRMKLTLHCTSRVAISSWRRLSFCFRLPEKSWDIEGWCVKRHRYSHTNWLLSLIGMLSCRKTLGHCWSIGCEQLRCPASNLFDWRGVQKGMKTVGELEK